MDRVPFPPSEILTFWVNDKFQDLTQATRKALAQKLAEMESRIETHDEAIQSLVSAIRQLMAASEKPPKKIGFQLREKRAAYGSR